MPQGWLISVHAQPGAKRSALAGLHGDALKVRIAAPAVEGRANAALVEFLAAQLGLPRQSVSVARGSRGRRKTLLVAAPDLDPEVLLRA